MKDKRVSRVSKVSQVPRAILFNSRGTRGTRTTRGTLLRGFTLVELLVAITILGILSTIGLGNFVNSQMKGRDGQRKSDLHQLQNALEIYYNDKGGYPLSATDGRIKGPVNTSGCDDSQLAAAMFGCDPTIFSGCSAANAARYSSACDYTGDGIIDLSDFTRMASEVPLTWGTDAFASRRTVYMKKLPTDPTGSPQYCYKASDDRSKYQLFAKLENANDPAKFSTDFTCGTTTDYNFGVTSPNTNLEETL